MPVSSIGALIQQITTLAMPAADTEITLECEPGTMNSARLAQAKASGVNRISVCAQALDDETLASLERLHTTKDALSLVDDCISAGIENIHLDLMYGLPNQTRENWRDCLRRAVDLPLTHISAYKFYTYRHGALHRRRLSEPVPNVADETVIISELMLRDAQEILEGGGFVQYSLTEFARPGWKSRYVTSCFAGDDVLPIGPAAFGRCGDQLWDNSPYLHLYGTYQSYEHDRAIVMSRSQAFKRDIVLGLWLLNVSVPNLAARHGVTPSNDLLTVLFDLDRQGLIAFDGSHIAIRDHQRFGVGAAMQRLADFPDSAWIEGVDSQGPVFAPEGTRHGYRSLSPEMNTLLRMARRDPAFFVSLVQSPVEALKVVDHTLTSEEFSALVDAVSNRAAPVDNYRQLVQEEWGRVVAENPVSEARIHGG